MQRDTPTSGFTHTRKKSLSDKISSVNQLYFFGIAGVSRFLNKQKKIKRRESVLIFSTLHYLSKDQK